MKKQIVSGWLFLTVLCAVPGSAQKNLSNEEKFVTELIKLKNVPDCDEKDLVYFSGRKIGYKNLINSLKTYLTQEGAIELDKRSKVIIITDVESNIEVMKALTAAFDYGEMFLIGKDEQDVDYGRESYTGFAGHPSN